MPDVSEFVVEPEDTSPQPAAASAWRWIPSAVCLGVAAAMAILLLPPPFLLKFVGSEMWTRLAVGFLLFVVSHLMLIAAGIIDGRAGLPLGISFERMSGDFQPAMILDELKSLRRAHDQLFGRLEQLNNLVTSTIATVHQSAQQHGSEEGGAGESV
jgi:hypothetical protein